MQHVKLSLVLVALAPLLAASVAQAQQPPTTEEAEGPQVTVVDPNQPDPAVVNPPPNAPAQENPIPPNVEGQAIPAQGGGYCYGGPHPAPGGGWEATTSPHMHDYAPFDLRLFSYHEGCYYFVGDPHDFGYTGESYSYYGAHPILDTYGGGWCFMIGAHTHWWRPWSPNFTVVGPWYYWNGPYDPFFWSYWPYYSFFYRSYYPGYYAGGRYFRNWRTAPAISHVPATGWRGGPAGGWRGSPAATRANGFHSAAPVGGAWHGSGNLGNAYHAAPAAGSAWHGSPAAGGGWHGPQTGGAWHGSPVPSTSAPLRSYGNTYGGGTYGGGTYGGGWHGPSTGGWHSAPSTGGGWHAPSSGGWHSAPSSGGFHGGGGSFHGGGGFHSGGGFHGGRR
jgi:hypothetical protein